MRAHNLEIFHNFADGQILRSQYHNKDFLNNVKGTTGIEQLLAISWICHTNSPGH